MKRDILIAINAFLWGTVVYLIYWWAMLEIIIQGVEDYYVLFV